jgi:hypothetical protein
MTFPAAHRAKLHSTNPDRMTLDRHRVGRIEIDRHAHLLEMTPQRHAKGTQSHTNIQYRE